MEAAELVGAEALGAAGVGRGGVLDDAGEGVPARRVDSKVQ